MKIEHAGVGFDSNFKPPSIDFSIGDPTMIIYLLRNKLYSDKLRVFLQEYISNGRDANREAGTPEHELDITYPSKTEPIFKVRDYGPGLSTERVESVFTVFGASTKRATDEFIGGFGIGAKSAWAYTDSFVVTSYHDGTERQYLCHIGTTQKGSMDLIHEAPTDLRNGVEIQVQVKENDIFRAQNLIRTLTVLWPQQPRYFNDPNTVLPEDAGYEDPVPHMPFRIFNRYPDSDHGYGGNFVSVDGIPYRFEDKFLDRLLGDFYNQGKPYMENGYQYHKSRSNSVFVFEARTGEIDIAASREQIEINDKFKQFKENLYFKILEGFEKIYREEAAKGAESFLKFLSEDYLSRLRYKRTEGHDNQQAILFGKDRVQCFYEEAIKACRKSLKKKADLLIGNLPKDTAIENYCFWFPEVKTFVADGKVYPFDLLDIEYYYRHRDAPAGFYGNRRKETFCATQKMSSSYGRGANPKNYAYDAEELKPERIKQLTRRVPKEIFGILKVKDVPKSLKLLGCRPLTEVLTRPQPSYRSYSASPKAGSVRSISTNMSGDLSFSGFQDAAGIQSLEKDFVYAWTSEKNEWKEKIKPLFTRMRFNNFEFVQLNKKALKTIKEQNPDRTYTHWIEWEKKWNANKKPFTDTEWNLFGLSWLRDSFRGVFNNFVEIGYSHRQEKAITDKVPEYAELSRIYQEITAKESDYREFVRLHGKKVKNLKKSSVYRLRCEMLQKYPGLHLIEMTYLDNNGHMTSDDFLNYFKNPNKFLRTFGKKLTSIDEWKKVETREY